MLASGLAGGAGDTHLSDGSNKITPQVVVRGAVVAHSRHALWCQVTELGEVVVVSPRKLPQGAGKVPLTW